MADTNLLGFVPCLALCKDVHLCCWCCSASCCWICNDSSLHWHKACCHIHVLISPSQMFHTHLQLMSSKQLAMVLHTLHTCLDPKSSAWKLKTSTWCGVRTTQHAGVHQHMDDTICWHKLDAARRYKGKWHAVLQSAAALWDKQAAKKG